MFRQILAAVAALPTILINQTSANFFFGGTSILIVVGVPAGLIMALTAEAVRPENRSVGMGVFYTWHFACMAILPSLAGSARDLADSAAAPIRFAAAVMVLSPIALGVFRLVQRRMAA